MDNNAPDFIPDDQMPDFIPDGQAGDFMPDTPTRPSSGGSILGDVFSGNFNNIPQSFNNTAGKMLHTLGFDLDQNGQATGGFNAARGISGASNFAAPLESVPAKGSGILTGITDRLAEGLGRTSLGKGGNKFPEILRESGNRIMGGADDIKGNLFELTKPIRENLNSLLTNSKGAITPGEIFGTSNDMGIKMSEGLLDKLSSQVGHTEKGAAKDYINTLKSSYQDSVLKYLQESGLPPEDVARTMQDDTFELPLSFWNDFLHGVGRDVGNKWVNIQQGKFVPSQEKIGTGLYGWLKKEIADRSGDAKTVNKLNELLKATYDINSSLAKKEVGEGIMGTLKTLGLPAEILGSLALGHPGIAASGVAGKIATSPKLATPIVNALSSPQTRALDSLLSRLGIGSLNSLRSQ